MVLIVIGAVIAAVYLILKPGGATALVAAIPGVTSVDPLLAPMKPPSQFAAVAGASDIKNYYGGTDPFASQYSGIAAKYAKNIFKADQSNFISAVGSSLSRRFPFDPSKQTWHIQCAGGATVSFGGGGAQAGLQVGGTVAAALTGGLAAPFISIFGGLFAKAQAQKRANIVSFETALCNVEQTFSTELPALDTAVATQQISASDGIAALQAMVTELTGQLEANGGTPAERGAMLWWVNDIFCYQEVTNLFYNDLGAKLAAPNPVALPKAA